MPALPLQQVFVPLLPLQQVFVPAFPLQPQVGRLPQPQEVFEPLLPDPEQQRQPQPVV